MKKILITGDLKYHNKGEIKDFIFELKNRYDKEIKVATLANNYGVDTLVKKYALEFDVIYGEFNAYHTHHRMYDIMPVRMFNKKYHKINFVYRDSHAVNWADIIILFLIKEPDDNFKRIIRAAKKKNKIIKIIKE